MSRRKLDCACKDRFSHSVIGAQFSAAGAGLPLAVYLFSTPRPSRRYVIPPYLIAKELRDGLIPFPYLVRTVSIPCVPC